MTTFAYALRTRHHNDPTALRCAWCRWRKPREEFRETPWHGRAAACARCENWTYWDEQRARAQWQLEQARETARGLRRGLGLIRSAQLRALPQRYVLGMRGPIR